MRDARFDESFRDCPAKGETGGHPSRTPQPTAPWTHNATPDVLHIVDVKDSVLPVHLTACSALNPDYLPVRNRPDFARMDWAAFQACIEGRLPRNPVLYDEESNDNCVEELTGAI
jgi:hypothetical protein